MATEQDRFVIIDFASPEDLLLLVRQVRKSNDDTANLYSDFS